jgi:EmrB/QacA subfamily drug resistance transporter
MPIGRATMSITSPDPQLAGDQPPRARLVLVALILGAIVTNMNLAIVNVTLPTISASLDTPQSSLNLIAIGFLLGLAASVLYTGAIADRYGRRKVYMVGTAFSIVTAILAAIAPTTETLIGARILGGFAAGAMYPVTLSMLSALFKREKRTGATALWSGASNGATILAPILGGICLLSSNANAWRWVFLVTIPLALAVLVLSWIALPAKCGETTSPVDHRSGVISVIAVGSLVLAINLVADGISTAVIVSAVITLIAAAAFIVSDRRAKNPLLPFSVVKVRTFWVAFVTGVIVFGGLMGALFIGQQFTQNVLGYEPLGAALAVLPFGLMSILASFPAGKLITKRGSRPALLLGLSLVLGGFVVMLLTWKQHISYAPIGLGYVLLGAGVGIAAPATARDLMASVTASKGGVGSAATDLTRDFGGALFQSMMGAVLAAGYAASFDSQLASQPGTDQITATTKETLTRSYSGAVEIADKYPQYKAAVLDAGQQAFVKGSQLGFAVGVIGALLAIAITWFFFPRRDAELATYAAVAGE